MANTYSLNDLIDRFKSLFVRVYGTDAPREDPLRHTTASMEVEMADADVEIKITKRPKVKVGTQAVLVKCRNCGKPMEDKGAETQWCSSECRTAAPVGD